MDQAARSHLSSEIAVFAGGIALLIGAVLTFHAASLGSEITGAAMTAVASGLAIYLSKTFLRTYEMTIQQMSHYYVQPVVNCYLLHAERLLEQLDEHDRKHLREDALPVVSTALKMAEQAATRSFNDRTGTPR